MRASIHPSRQDVVLFLAFVVCEEGGSGEKMGIRFSKATTSKSALELPGFDFGFSCAKAQLFLDG